LQRIACNLPVIAGKIKKFLTVINRDRPQLQLAWMALVWKFADFQRTSSFERTTHYYTVSWEVNRYPAAMFGIDAS
jgi:hypothetical protein